VVVGIVSTLWEKLHPFYSHHNFVKSRSLLIIFSAQIPGRICNKYCQNYPPHLMVVITLPCETQNVSICS